MDVLKNFFIHQGSTTENHNQDQEATTHRPLSGSNSAKLDLFNEGNSTSRASAIQSPDSSRAILKNIGGFSLNKHVRSTKVSPITIHTKNNASNSNYGTPQKNNKHAKNINQKNRSIELSSAKSDHRPINNTKQPLRRANTVKIPAFNPRDYEETFEEINKARKSIGIGRKRTFSAEPYQGVDIEREFSSSNSSSLNSLSKSSSEISDDFQNNPTNEHQKRGNQSMGSIAEQRRKQSMKFERSQTHRSSRKSNRGNQDNENDGGVKDSPLQNIETGDYNKNDYTNIGFYEDVDFGNRSEDEYTIYRQKTRIKPSFTWRLRMDPEYQDIKYILLPDDRIKIAWDMIIIFLLLYTTIVLPLRMAYLDDSAKVWEILDGILNALFIVDIFVNLFSAYFDNDLNLIVDRKKIIKNYLLGWFFLDLCAVIPFDVIIGASNSYQQLLRIARISRLYKLPRMTKLVRMIKVIRERATILRYINQIFEMTPQVERLVVSFIAILIFVHVSACLWKFILDFNVDEPNNWLKIHGFYDINGNVISSQFDIYTASAYMIVQTVVTVGYGDLVGQTTTERIACGFWMFIGVFIYSFTIGSLTSLISSVDTQQTSELFSLSICLIMRYIYRQAQDNLEFLKDLPLSLSQDLSCIIHSDIIDAIPFFADKPRSFIATLGPLLRPMRVGKGDYIFLEGDPADEIFFLKTGTVAYVIPKYYNFKFLKVKEGYYFGEIDLLFYGEIRKYTVQAVKTCELYVLNKKDFKQLFLMEFREIGLEFADLALSRKIRTRKTYKEALAFLTKGGAKTDSAGLQHKVTAFEDRFLKIEEDEDDAESEAEEENDLLPRSRTDLNIMNREELIKIEQLENDDANKLGKSANEKKQLSSRFLEASLFSPMLGKLLSENEPTPSKRMLHLATLKGDPLHSNSIAWGENQEQQGSQVTGLNQKVTEIQDKVNNLLEMSIRLKDNSELLTPVNKTFKKSDTSNAKPDNIPTKTLPMRKSISYSSSEGFFDFLKPSGSQISPAKTIMSEKTESVVLSRATTENLKKDIDAIKNIEETSESASSASEEEEMPMLKDLLLKKYARDSSANKVEPQAAASLIHVID